MKKAILLLTLSSSFLSCNTNQQPPKQDTQRTLVTVLHDKSLSYQAINTMKTIVVSICLIEIIVGYLYMPATHKALSLSFTNQFCKLWLKRKNNAARHTDESWVRYQFDCQTYNNTYGTNIPCAEETPLIREAPAYYNNGYGEQESITLK